MKSLIIFSILSFCADLFAQTNLPRAGEFSKENFHYEYNLNSKPLASRYTEILDFDSSNVSFSGNYPFAESYALTLSDTLAFVGSGGGILITDVSNPAAPVIISELRTRSLVDACSYDPVNKRLYVCAYFSGIEIWDLTNISNPVRMSRIATEPYPRAGISFSGNYIFFATNNSVYSYDVTDPYNPVMSGQLFISQNLIFQCYLKDTVLFLSMNLEGIKTIDVSDPSALQLIAASAYGSSTRFNIKDDYLYAVNGSGWFQILNASNPAAITYTSGLNLGGYSNDIVVFGNKAYIAKGGTGGALDIINVENPATPALITSYSGDFGFIEGEQDYVFITRNSDFTILDIRNPGQITAVGGYMLAGFVQDVSSRGSYLYTGSNGFRVIDISDPSHPVQKGYAPINAHLSAPAGNDLVVFSPWSMTANNTIHVMDVSDPINPVSLDSYTCPVMTWDLKVQDTLFFVGCWWDGIRIFNIKDPSNIIQIAHPMGWVQGGTPGVDWFYVQAIAISGTYLYAIDYKPFPDEDTYGLYILDISNPSSPALVNRYTNLAGTPQDIVVKDGYAYIADGEGGVEIVDVTDPLNPNLIRYIDLPDGATGITASGDYVYLSNYILGGVQVVDISDPAAAEIAGWYKPTGVFAVNISYDNGYIFAADGLGGIQIYRNLLEPTAINDNVNTVNDFALTNYPNPFNPSTLIEYSIPKSAMVKIRIFNALGEEISVLLNDFVLTGTHRIQFNGKGLSSGVYLCTIESDNLFLARKMILLK